MTSPTPDACSTHATTSAPGREDWEEAAAIFRRCRHVGFTPSSRIDCLVAAVALRNDVPVLHHDADFDGIAACTGLEVVSGL